ncbi:UDP-N-acetylglucosamine 2-epimerase (non-hydrolyzing) [Candidatus Poribacteria bacterium]|nr:UDP-N-acetylglucosamine 2-epimerase (non-hydrolyzing) [Candidatus Poribacteria bacterium]
MKIMTVLGTRPEIIRLCAVIKKLDKYCHHILVHTGQNYDERLSDIFFHDLELRQPDYYLGVKEDTFGKQIGKILSSVEEVIIKEKPDRILILGDTNSGLVSIIAKRMGIPVFHMEAGNRCFDDRVPEEVNRKIIDHSSTIHLPYTNRSKENLLNEGINTEGIYIIGNPILEVIESFSDKIEKCDVLNRMNLKPREYFLVTMHRAENVDIEDRLRSIVLALNKLNEKYKIPVCCSLHPRTKNKMQKFGLSQKDDKVMYLEPLGFIDFITLEKNARCVITDSGTVQEECCIFGIPNITIRDVTERPETIESGSNMLVGISTQFIVNSVNIITDEENNWSPPIEYVEKNVSSKVIKIILGYNRNR